jgi:hypothetical protein
MLSELRQLPDSGVVNNSAYFFLAINRAIVINRFNANSMESRQSHQNSHGSFGIVSLLTQIPGFIPPSLSPQRACG